MHGIDRPQSNLDRAEAYAQAEHWLSTGRREAAFEHRMAWGAAALCACLVIAQGFALALIQPLQVPVTLVAETDRDGGGAQANQKVRLGPLAKSDAIVAAEIAKYVQRRESFAPQRFDADYRAVTLASAGAARSQYISSWSSSLPGSRRASNTIDARVRAEITGVMLASADTALVTYSVSRWSGGSWSAPSPSSVRIRYSLSERALGPVDRLSNPFGLQVTEYQS